LFSVIAAWDALAGRPKSAPLATPLAAGYFYFFCVLLVGELLRSSRGFTAALGPLLLVAATFYTKQSVSAHIDTFRIFLLTAGLVALGNAATSNRWRDRLLAAISLTAAFYSHSASVLMIPVGAVVLFIAGWRRARGTYSAATTVLVSLLIWMPWAIRNYWLLGSPVSDMGPDTLFAHPAVRYFEVMRIERGIDSWGQRLIWGALIPWSGLAFFGPAPWLALTALLFAPARLFLREKVIGDLGILAVAVAPIVYLLLALFTIPASNDLFLKNIRYPMTFIAGWALLGAALFGRCSTPWTNRHRAVVAVAICFVAYHTFSACYSVRASYQWLREMAFSSDPDRYVARRANLAAIGVLSKSGRVLSFQQAETGIYTSSFFSYYHPRLRPVYDALSVQQAHAALRRLGIESLVVRQDHAQPFFSMSWIAPLVGDPSLADTLYADENWTAFRFVDRRVRQELWTPEKRPSSAADWLTAPPGVQFLRSSPPRASIEGVTEALRLEVPSAVLQSRVAQAAIIDPRVWVVRESPPPIAQVTLRVKGRGIAQIVLLETGPDGVKPYGLWHGLIDGTERSIRAQRPLSPGAKQLELRYQLRGEGILEVSHPTITKVWID
jgi:hypothetical protein